jgi:hypothetical protein
MRYAAPCWRTPRAHSQQSVIAFAAGPVTPADHPTKEGLWGRGHGLHISGEALWADCGQQATVEWARLHPGTRPRPWWRYSAPEPRQRLGGTGDLTKEAIGLKSLLVLGVPWQWLNDVDVGNRPEPVQPGLTQPSPSPIRDVALDRDDPPMFESEPAYLDRLQLWLP